ncbi:MAG: SRPBCC domain-containing protein [Pseudomonadota bacterium]
MKPFVIERVVDAPRERVWQAWTEVEQLKRWWGPKGFVVTHCTNDLRPGGLMHYCLRGPDGREMWGKFVYREIAKPERLVWINSFSDKDKGTTVHPMMPTWPREMHTAVTFEEQGGKTKITVRWVPIEGSNETERKTFDEGRPSMSQGWSGTFEQFDNFLKG